MRLKKIVPDLLQAQFFVTLSSGYVWKCHGEPEEIHEQLNRDFKGRFRWKLLHDGPDLWVVKIAKLNGFHFELR